MRCFIDCGVWEEKDKEGVGLMKKRYCLVFYEENVEMGGVTVLVRLCSSRGEKRDAKDVCMELTKILKMSLEDGDLDEHFKKSKGDNVKRIRREIK